MAKDAITTFILEVQNGHEKYGRLRGARTSYTTMTKINSNMGAGPSKRKYVDRVTR